jgi:uncharacterized protein YdaT
MQVKKQTVLTRQEAIAVVEQKLQEGYGNIRIITTKSKLAKRYKILNGQVQVRYW